jgi:hypothetical protein
MMNSITKDIMGVVITVSVVYALYEWLKVQCIPGSGSLLLGTSVCNDFENVFGGGQPSAPAAEATPANVSAAALLTAAGTGNSATTMNVDQWSFYWAQVSGSPISASVLTSAFPALTASNRLSMTAAQFVNAIHSTGLSGIEVSPFYRGVSTSVPGWLLQGVA